MFLYGRLMRNITEYILDELQECSFYFVTSGCVSTKEKKNNKISEALKQAVKRRYTLLKTII